jgi:biotin operon repressor
MTTKEMTKEELVAKVAELEQIILNLQNKKGRKFEVLELLKTNTSISIVEIAERLNISTKNVSSQLTYLREEGYNVCTNSQGRKFLVESK